MRKYLVISNDLINIDKNKISTDNNDTINIISAIQKKFEIYLLDKKFKTGAIERPVKLKSLENSRFGNVIPEGEAKIPATENAPPQTEQNAKVKDSESKEEVKLENNAAPIPLNIEPEPTLTPSQKEKVGIMDSPPNDLFAPEQNIEAKTPVENPLNVGLDNLHGELEPELDEQPVLNEPQEDKISEIKDEIGQEKYANNAVPESEPISTETLKVAEKEEPLIIAIPETLEEHWSKFVQTFPASQRVAIENATFRLEGTILIATISTGAPLSSFEEIQFSFASFTRINPCGAITQVAFEKGIIVHDDSKPYTDAEKVEYLRQKHPLLKQMMDDWKLH